ncbi:hypothetical protein HU200_033915 [Digitaria exilis]|uniref:Uncharacterized protein n=1 Tax=Digitaria exilis TaxID=1010633 RepID=A0A835BKW0_9POAL|nr:hypothetical protein HU200_033915 [Digitaria exilis]
MACKPCYNTNGYAGHHQATKITSFPRAPAPPQPPLLPLPEQYSSFVQPASRPVSRAKKPRCYEAAPGPGASAPITVAAPSKNRMAPATTGLAEEGWTGMDSLYSVSPPPSSVPMPTSLLLAATAARKAPTACAVEVAGGVGCGVDVGATDELRRLLRL